MKLCDYCCIRQCSFCLFNNYYDIVGINVQMKQYQCIHVLMLLHLSMGETKDVVISMPICIDTTALVCG